MSLADGNPGTSWATVCYSSRFMGGKQGVGLVVTFDEPAHQALTVDVQTGPYQVDFFATDAETIPASLAEWGPALGSTAFANEAETVVSPTPSAPARHMLVLLKELGQDGSCTDQNPYRGRLGEIALVELNPHPAAAGRPAPIPARPERRHHLTRRSDSLRSNHPQPPR